MQLHCISYCLTAKYSCKVGCDQCTTRLSQKRLSHADSIRAQSANDKLPIIPYSEVHWLSLHTHILPSKRFMSAIAKQDRNTNSMEGQEVGMQATTRAYSTQQVGTQHGMTKANNAIPSGNHNHRFLRCRWYSIRAITTTAVLRAVAATPAPNMSLSYRETPSAASGLTEAR